MVHSVAINIKITPESGRNWLGEKRCRFGPLVQLGLETELHVRTDFHAKLITSRLLTHFMYYAAQFKQRVNGGKNVGLVKEL